MQIFLVKRLAQKFFTSRFLLTLLFLASACSDATTPAPSSPTPLPPPPRTVTSSTPTTTLTPTRVSLTHTRAAVTMQTHSPTTPLWDPTSTPNPTPLGTPPLPPASDTNVYFQAVTIAAYPYENFLYDAYDRSTNFSLRALDRDAYNARVSARDIRSKTFRAVILENRYLKLAFLPELGGRLYQITYKPTNQNLLYNNPVLKPTPWGMSIQKGWLAAGGIEWAFPTQEHGYEWNAPWNFETQVSDAEAMILLRDSDAVNRARVRLRVVLPAGAAYFRIETRVENPTAQPQRLQFWNNAMLNLGAEKISPQTEIIFPSDAVFLHTTANEWIPREWIPGNRATAPSVPVSMSNLAGRDLRWFQNWDTYLGFFAVDTAPAELATNFVGAYNHATQLGIARVFPPADAPGVKVFAFGPNFCCRDAYTDDASEYFELWGGIPRTFFPDDDVTFAAGETRAWTEYWLPLAGTNGLDAAAQDAALTLDVRDHQAMLTAYSAVTRAVHLVLKQNNEIVFAHQVTLTPDQVWSNQVSVSNDALEFQMRDLNDQLIVTAR